jgi:perosamine synthetase
MIQVFRPSMGQEEIDAVAEVIKSGWIGLGPKTAEFEKTFAEYIAVDHAVGVNSATSALDLALKLLHINHGDEVIVPTITFVSTAHVVAYNLATPIFADVDPVTLSIDIEDVKNKITRRTKAIIPVHYSGRPVDMDSLRAVAGDIPIIEDAAHACGAEYKGRKCGSLGDIGCFSFHAVKNLAMGDGGALTLNNKAMAERAKRLRWLGIDRGTWDRSEIDKSYWWEYFVDEIGLKCHMNDIMAAMGLVQLTKLERMNARRREIASTYTAALNITGWIETPPPDNADYKSAWHIYCVKADNRDALSVHLQENGIATGVHYKPIHLYRCYGNRPSLPVAERLFQRILSLPMYPGLTDGDIDKVINSIISFGGKTS